MNVGAETETDYGDYFMWGSTTPNTPDECNWANAPFNNGVNSYNSTYFDSVKNTVCPNGILAKEYDAAAQIMGGDWRMPTRADFNELLNKTRKEWTRVNGVDGYKFTSKTDESKYIFIPAAGYCENGSVYDIGGYGNVWSSSLYTLSPGSAWCLNFNLGYCGMDGHSRYDGLSVRGVL